MEPLLSSYGTLVEGSAWQVPLRCFVGARPLRTLQGPERSCKTLKSLIRLCKAFKSLVGLLRAV